MCVCFFFNDTATTEIYTLSLHDALPISGPLLHRERRRDPVARAVHPQLGRWSVLVGHRPGRRLRRDRKSTRLNSSHANISYAVFCLKKKKTTHYTSTPQTITINILSRML